MDITRNQYFFAGLLLLPLASGQTTTVQPIHVWTSQPVYYPDDRVTVFWDKSGPCVIPGANGTLEEEGSGYRGVVNVDVLSGQYHGPELHVMAIDVGSFWAFRLTIHAPNGCVSEGSASVQIAQPVQQASAGPGGLPLTDYALIGVGLIIIMTASIAALRQRKKSSSQNRNKT